MFGNEELFMGGRKAVFLGIVVNVVMNTSVMETDFYTF